MTPLGLTGAHLFICSFARGRGGLLVTMSTSRVFQAVSKGGLLPARQARDGVATLFAAENASSSEPPEVADDKEALVFDMVAVAAAIAGREQRLSTTRPRGRRGRAEQS